MPFEPRCSALIDSQASLITKNIHPEQSRIEIFQQAALLRQSDVIVLNEVDWGVKRTDYRDVARDLASALGMNYAYGVEFVEVDPLVLGTETFEGVKNPSGEQRW